MEKHKLIVPIIFLASGFLLAGQFNSLRGLPLAGQVDQYRGETRVGTGVGARTSSDKDQSAVKGGWAAASPTVGPVDSTGMETGSQAGRLETSEPVGSKGKLTIVSSQPITADKSEAETGETVSFSVVLKNAGDKKKHLTHVCFNHSGGVTFACLNGPQGPNLDPGKTFRVNGDTKFTRPGTYSVWLTWSQDETNFYQPIGAGRAQVVID